jgi:hypothetical protein
MAAGKKSFVDAYARTDNAVVLSWFFDLLMYFGIEIL